MFNTYNNIHKDRRTESLHLLTVLCNSYFPLDQTFEIMNITKYLYVYYHLLLLSLTLCLLPHQESLEIGFFLCNLENLGQFSHKVIQLNFKTYMSMAFICTFPTHKVMYSFIYQSNLSVTTKTCTIPLLDVFSKVKSILSFYAKSYWPILISTF